MPLWAETKKSAAVSRLPSILLCHGFFLSFIFMWHFYFICFYSFSNTFSFYFLFLSFCVKLFKFFIFICFVGFCLTMEEKRFCKRSKTIINRKVNRNLLNAKPSGTTELSFKLQKTISCKFFRFVSRRKFKSLILKTFFFIKHWPF